MEPPKSNETGDNVSIKSIVPPTSAVVSSSFVSEPPSEQAIHQESNNLLDYKTGSDIPVPVVKVLSVRGVEYIMMSIALWLTAGGLIWILLSIIYKNANFSMLAFPVSLMLVCLPVFSVFYLRLKKQELLNPELKMEPSKRRLSQITQVLAFIVCLFNIIGYVYIIISKIGSDNDVVIWQATLGLLAILAVAGGILTYYWFDEHKNVRK